MADGKCVTDTGGDLQALGGHSVRYYRYEFKGLLHMQQPLL